MPAPTYLPEGFTYQAGSVSQAPRGRVVELRYFGGYEEEEIADMLGISYRTVRRDWRKARAFLLAELGA